MKVDEVLSAINDVKLEFQREEDQGLLQHDLHKAEQALAGKYACERILRRLARFTEAVFIEPRTASRAR
jgi:hypothetical protein